MDIIIDLNLGPSSQPLSTPTLRAELLVVIVAGADNTTAAICTTLYQIISHPSPLSRALAELDFASAVGQLSPIPQFAEILAHCSFYIAYLKESLRLNPSLASFVPRYSSSNPLDPLIINGRTIQLNMEVGSNPWITQHDPEVYGEDAEE